MNSPVAIVLCTYNPDPGFFKQQIASLLRQTHRDWRCYILDDSSLPETYAAIEEIAADERFSVARNPRRVGVFRNFEENLKRTGEDIIFLCDQDDIWDDDKIEVMLAAFDDPAVQGVHSDLRLIDETGTVFSPSTFRYETRYTRPVDQQSLILRNIVTGCAFAFRRDVLRWALPFPRQERTEFSHDCWLALCCLSVGKLHFLARATGSYRQHATNDIGARRRGPFILPILKAPLRAFADAIVFLNIRRRLANHLAVATASAPKPFTATGYLHRLLPNLAHFGKMLANLPGSRGLFRGCVSSLGGLIALSARDTVRWLLERSGGAVTSAVLPELDVKDRFLSKAMQDEDLRIDVRLSVDPDGHSDVIFIPSLSSAGFFAGNRTIARLALVRAQRPEASTAIVITSHGISDGEHDKLRLSLAAEFDHTYDASSIAFYGHDAVVPVRPGAVTVVTAWWTAYYLEEELKRLPVERYYLIQDYEPWFYPAGWRFWSAYRTYLMDYRWLVSSKPLHDHMMRQFPERDGKALLLEPDFSYDLVEEIFERRRRRRANPSGGLNIFIYFRPWVDRNEPVYAFRVVKELYSRGVITGKDTLMVGGDGMKDLTFYGARAVWLGKMGRAEYYRRFTDYDLVLSFLSSPHSGVVHYETAMAGIPSVTNTVPGIKETPHHPNLHMVDLDIEKGVEEIARLLTDVRSGAIGGADRFERAAGLGNDFDAVVGSLNAAEPRG